VLPFALAALARLEAALALVTRERDEGDAGYEVASKAWNENQARIKELEAERGQP